MSKIFEATVGIVKMGNTISLNFPYTAWRNGYPELINGKPIRFSSNGQNHDYTIRISDAQAENIMLMFTTTPDSLVDGQTYTVTIYERDFPSSNTTEEWRPMSRTETIQRGTDTINRSDLLPSQSYTDQGRDGTELVEWEEKFVNGVSTGEIRNERRTTQISVINNKQYVGTKSEAPTQPEPNGAVIDFRNTEQVFYDGDEMKEAWYMSEKIWKKKRIYVWESSFGIANTRIDVSKQPPETSVSEIEKVILYYQGKKVWEGTVKASTLVPGNWELNRSDSIVYNKIEYYFK
ncbi:hypothetical protein [Eremococcus coleocola]|uniref:hypothetical protein n=1 Tax=Eremococcus coleocola TaxID=88132 RepID=UPI0003F5A599|nr:hypothetical protein [Eremococcus coleocola]